ncbi:MAG: flippase [Patescibacteria group bacterium]
MTLKAKISRGFYGVRSFLFHNTSVRQTLAKNTFWLTVSNVGGRLLRAIIIVYAARVLGAGEWGAFSYAITLIGMLTIVTDFGVNSILTREITKRSDPAEQTRYLATALIMKVVLLAPSMLFVVFFGPVITSLAATRAILPIVAIILAFDTIRDFGFAVIRAHEKMEFEARAFIFTNAAITGLGFVFLALSPTITSFAWSYAVGTGLGAVAALLPLRDHLRKPFSHFERKLVRPILASAWPFALSGLLGGLMISTDVLLIGWLRTAEEVGFYSVAQRVVFFLYLIPGVLATSIFPALARTAKHDAVRARRLTEFTLGVAFLAALPIMAGGWLLAPGIIQTLFGDAYSPAAPAFAILTLTLAATFAGVILSNVVFAYDRQRYLIIYAAIGGGLNVILDILLIPPFGIIGSAIATFIVQFVAIAYLWRVTKFVLPFHILPHLKKIIPATIAMAAIVYGLDAIGASTVVNIAISALVYFAILVLLREPILREARRTLGGLRGA